MYLKLGKRNIELRLILVVVAGLTLVAVLITVTVMLAGRSTDIQRESPVVSEPDEDSWVDAGDLIVPDELARGTELRWVAFRERRERWTEAQAREHWIDPREIGRDVLASDVEKTIREILEEVP